MSDDEANEFAEDLILALFEAKWDVKSLHPQGIIVDRPAKGLLIYYKQMGDTTHEHLENALKKLGFPDVQSFWDMQEPTDIVVVVGTCTSCRSN